MVQLPVSLVLSEAGTTVTLESWPVVSADIGSSLESGSCIEFPYLSLPQIIK